MAHLYASFADASLAEKAAGALLDYGVRQEDISLVANDQYGQTRESYATSTTTAPATQIIPQDGAFGTEGTAAGYGQVAAATAGRSVAVYDNTTVADVNDPNPLDQGGPDSYASQTSQTGQSDVETAAKHGISTTTPEDAGSGAVKGTVAGLGIGILASLAALTIPGVGIVLGGGALASALGATALAAGAGAVAGGATGYLKDQGVPAEAAERYHGTVTSGGAVLSIAIPSGNVDQPTAESILSKYGAADVNTY